MNTDDIQNSFLKSVFNLCSSVAAFASFLRVLRGSAVSFSVSVESVTLTIEYETRS
jgi:hypothetical protein